jgi:tRNA-specific 2-thiouridylase
MYGLYDKTENSHRYVFPLSDMKKSDVRRLAADAGLDVASKPDSQGICFIGDIKIREFIQNHIKAHSGIVTDLAGNEIGSHAGVQFYTIGQRHGFKITSYTGDPRYIVSKNIKENVLVVGTRSEASSREFIISDCSFPYSIEDYLEKFNDLGLSVRLRNLGRKIPCRVISVEPEVIGDQKLVSLENKKSSRNFRVVLSNPEFGVSAGQSAVFYLGRLMIGGGVISSSAPVIE